MYASSVRVSCLLLIHNVGTRHYQAVCPKNSLAIANFNLRYQYLMQYKHKLDIEERVCVFYTTLPTTVGDRIISIAVLHILCVSKIAVVSLTE